jgi:polysaccharide deacetylase family protein (PEP-CTERM system associated)
VDVEDYFHVAALAESISRDDWDGMEYRAEANTHRLMDLFAEFGVQSTFFILGWVAQRSPKLVRAIHEAGHEVACHGMSHKLVYEQTPAEFERETRDSKALLEDIIGAPVAGYRAASWSVTRRSLWALDIIHSAGFEYDSSVFPIRHDIYGIPDAPKQPGLIRAPNGKQLVEFPPSTAKFGGVSVPVAGGGYFRLLPYWFTRMGLRQINRGNRSFNFYLHPWEVDPEQPRVSVGWKSKFRHYTNLGKTQQRLRDLLGEFRFTTMRNVLADLDLLPHEVPRTTVSAPMRAVEPVLMPV